MKQMVWMLGLVLLLPGCLNQKHYNEVMGSLDDVQTLKQNDKSQEQRIRELEKMVKDLQAGMKTEIRDQGVKVDSVKVDGAKAEAMPVESAQADGVRVTLPQAVLFSSGSTEINPEGRKVLAHLAQAALKQGGHGIRIVGYSDALPVGKELKARFTDNWELSAARAASVARVFVWGEGISPERIRVEGRGAADPVADNATAKGREQNRRIEIYIAG